MRTVFLGTSDFAVTVLRALRGSAHAPALVVTRPDRPKGRGRRLTPPPAGLVAREWGMPLIQPQSVNEAEARDAIAAAEPDALVVCAYGGLIGDELLADHEVLNVHPSLLPRWRGAAPVERAIMAGDTETGVSIMRLVKELDAGPVGLQEAITIEPWEAYPEIVSKLAALSGELLLRALDDPPAYVAQPTEGITYAEKIGAADRMLDPARPAIELERVVRALSSHIGARFGELGISAARAVQDEVSVGRLTDRDGRLLLGTSEGSLDLLAVQPPGKRPMSAADYLRGNPL